MVFGFDADARPNVIKEVLFRAADRNAITVTLVANQIASRTPPSKYIRSLAGGGRLDVADNEIAPLRSGRSGDHRRHSAGGGGDREGAVALNPRGERYTPDTIRERLNMRDFMGYPARQRHSDRRPERPNQRDRQQFANELDKWLLQAKRARVTPCSAAV